MAVHDQEQVAVAEKQILTTLEQIDAPSMSPRDIVSQFRGTEIHEGNALVALTELIADRRVELTPDGQVKPVE